ncbi:MAG: HNH endonuclease [Lachnospiraceae bacterium]|nr:HNH endonuclease [Lachnospiraceae bacterium]
MICDNKRKVIENQKKKSKHIHTDTYLKYHRSARWNKTSLYVRERDSYVCQICGKSANEVHHIIKIEEDQSKAYDENNLITLCHLCHLRAERGFIDKTILFNKVKESIKKYNMMMGGQ